MYCELHASSAFSFLDGASLPERLVERAADLGYPAIALLDRDGVYGLPRFHLAARRAGLKAIVGAELSLAVGGEARRRLTLPVLVASREGYRNLCRLATAMKLRAPKGEGALTLDDLDGRVGGLVALAGRSAIDGPRFGVGGIVDRLVGTFGAPNVCVELQRHLLRDEEADNQALLDLASAYHLPVIAANGVRFAEPGDRPLYDVLTCIRHRTTLDRAGRRLAWNAERYLKPPEAMARLFSDLPAAIAGTRELADRLEFTMADLGYRFPEYPVPPGETMASFLRKIAQAGARERYRPYHDRARAQVARELDLIEKLDLAGYFLIVWDIVNFCRQQDILVQGRGSAANSAVCYSLGITAVDPVGMDLLFERFLSEERGEWPDIDLDLPSGDRRERVIQHVYEKYGRHGAAMTANVITYRGRSAAREVGKALAIDPDRVDRLAKLMNHFEWIDPRETLARNLRDAGIDFHDPTIQLFGRLWQQIQDLPRHLGQHSGGMVICQGRLDEVVPLENASMPGRVVIQWDKDDCADMGIVKVDLLGLGMMSVIQDALAMVNSVTGAPAARASRRSEASQSEAGERDARGGGAPRAQGEDALAMVNGPVARGPWSVGRESAVKCSSEGPHIRSAGLPPSREALRRTAVALAEAGQACPDRHADDDGPRTTDHGLRTTAVLDLAHLPPGDPAVYRMLQEADTVGVFQVESRAQMATLPRLRPACFYDIVVEVAIIRPGPIVGQMVHPYLKRRQGMEPVVYPHPSLEPILARTLGVPLFQEQLLRMAMVAAGFSGGEAEELRRAFGFKRSEKRMQQIEGKLRAGMARQGIAGAAAEEIIRSITSFALYGFPESHAASFALLVYASAYLKAHYPAAFYTAMLNNQPMGFYHPATLVKDAQRHGVRFAPIDVQTSDWDCRVDPDGRVRLGLMYVNGLREDVGRAIAAPAARPPAPGEPVETGPATPAPVRCPKCGCDDESMIETSPEACFCNICAHEWTHRSLVPGAPGPGSLGSGSLGPGSLGSGSLGPGSPGPGSPGPGSPGPGSPGPGSLRSGSLGLESLGLESRVTNQGLRRFHSIEDLIGRTGIRRDELATLAEIGALNSFGHDRRSALWQIERAIRPSGELFDESRTQDPGLGTPDSELGTRDSGSGTRVPGPRDADPGTQDQGPRDQGPLCPMSPPERVMADYAGTSLTIGPHPMALRRAELALRGVLRARDLPRGRHGRRVRVAGAVITRQRPGTAKGFVFLTLEDETGIANIIVRPDLFAESKSTIVGEPYLLVEGTLQIQEGVTSVKADRVIPLVGEGPAPGSHDFR